MQTYHQCRGGLRVLRTSVMQRLHPIANRAPHGLFERLRGSTHTRRPGHANDSPTQRAKRVGKRALLLRRRRTFRSGGGCRLVHVALAIFDSVHWRVRGRVDCIGHLVRPGREKAKR